MSNCDIGWHGSPCRTCAESPCCRFLPITRLDPDSASDLHAIAELLRLRFIEVGLRDDGSWTVFYARPCANLDVRSGACEVHGSADQPPVCIRYDAASCWYRDAFESSANLGFIRFDHRRMMEFIERTIFDDAGRVYRIPRWEWMIEEFARARLPMPEPQSLEGDSPLQLRVPPGYPVRPGDWDLVTFRTAFPGVDLLDEAGDSAFSLQTEVRVDAPRLPTSLPSGLTLVARRRPRPVRSTRIGA